MRRSLQGQNHSRFCIDPFLHSNASIRKAGEEAERFKSREQIFLLLCSVASRSLIKRFSIDGKDNQTVGKR
jgi:hypothetical protein